MPRRMSDTLGMAEGEYPKKRIAPNGNKLPDPIREGEIFTDVTGTKWRLGKSIGVGGFGEIYLASADISKSVGPDAQYVIKVEPHKNGPLFVERSFYIRNGKPEIIAEWKRRKRLKHLGISCYYGSGSHVYKGERYRFLVLDRYEQDLNKLFLQCGRRFHTKTVFYLGIQILNVLEFIHSRGYIHGDIKGSNLLLGHWRGTTDQIHLLDFGLACRYVERNGLHKEYRCDERKAHNGTLEYTSRDAHIGAHSRRGDLEILGYNMLQWFCTKLPWEDSLPDGEAIHEQKKTYMANIPQLMRHCFPDSEPPVALSEYLKYVASLDFHTSPDYEYCRKLLQTGVVRSGFVDDGKLEFSNINSRQKSSKVKKRVGKRIATEEPENIAELKPKKVIRSSHRQPCVAHNFNRMTRNSPTFPVLRSHQQFSWEKVLSSNPEKFLSSNHDRLKKRPVQRNTTKIEVPRSKQPEVPILPFIPVDEDPGKPTPAMLEVMARMRERSSCQPAVLSRRNSRCSSPTQESPYPCILTPAMEQVIRRREELLQQERDMLQQNWIVGREFTRTTRSRGKDRPVCRRSLRTRNRTCPFVTYYYDDDDEDDEEFFSDIGYYSTC
ncbi:serine/threonine-protein kinase VRK1 isoform X2 [Anabrus simplex]|uniref:serine/threonine-protein kinase VRK1 isoform X2 n=1 Tax=Anabrus simplex TaxID=316456 RepID=UPI0034DD8B88